MAKIQSIRTLLTTRLTMVANEIFVAVEKTIAEYEGEVNRAKVDNAARLQKLLEEVDQTKEENARLQRMLDLVYKPNIQLRKSDPPPSHGPTQPHAEREFTIKMEEQEEPEAQVSQVPVKMEEEEQTLWNTPEPFMETEPDGGESEPEPSDDPSVNPQPQDLEPILVGMETGMEKPKQRSTAERLRPTFEDNRLGIPTNRKAGQVKSEANIDATECILPPTLQAERLMGSTSGLLRQTQSHAISRPVDHELSTRTHKMEAFAVPKSPVKDILSELAALCSFSSKAVSSSSQLRSARHKDRHTMPQNHSRHLRNSKLQPSDATPKPGGHSVQFLNAFTNSCREKPVTGAMVPSVSDVARHKDGYTMAQNHSRQRGNCKLQPSEATPKCGGNPVQLLTAFTESYIENSLPRVLSASDVLPSPIHLWPSVTPTSQSSEESS